jgi:hypothetical protein
MESRAYVSSSDLSNSLFDYFALNSMEARSSPEMRAVYAIISGMLSFLTTWSSLFF